MPLESLDVRNGREIGDDLSLRIVISDPDAQSREAIVRMLLAEEGITILGVATGGEESLQVIRKHSPNLVFISVHVPGEEPFSLLQNLNPAERPEVIFVTKYDQYAWRAFEVSAVDYLLKPFGRERLQQALEKAKEAIRKRNRQSNSPTEKIERLVIQAGKRMFFLKPEEIDWIEAEGNYVRVHSKSESHMLKASISALEKKLDNAKFVRIHRSTIVNVDRIRWLEPASHGNHRVILLDGTKLVLTRKDKLAQLKKPL